MDALFCVDIKVQISCIISAHLVNLYIYFQFFIILFFYLQAQFGPSGSDPSFKLFQSETGRNLIFKDSTKCLQEIKAGTSYDQFLGADYMSATTSLRQCSETTSGWYYCGFKSRLTGQLFNRFPLKVVSL